MRSLCYTGPNQLELREAPKPEPKEGEVLLRVRACGICGSDVHGFLGLTGRRLPPMTMGHEFSAEVAQLGPATGKFKVGDGVVVQPIHFCGHCVNCRNGMTNMCLNKEFFGVLDKDGAMAEYVAVPEKLLYPLSKGCDYTIGALSEPFAVAYGAVKKAGSLTGKTVLIIGAGTIGICILQLVKLKHPARVVVSDLSDTRLAAAKELGADVAINPKRDDAAAVLSELTDGVLADVTIEAVGVQATANQSILCLRVGGKAIWVGMSQKEMTINMQDIVCSARQVIGSFNYTHEEFGEVVQLLGSGAMEARRLISKVVSLEEAPQAFVDPHEQPDSLLKIIIDPTK